MLKRKIYSELLKWKNDSKGTSALLIEGARRVGKTKIAEYFGENEFPAYKTIDFSKESEDVINSFNDLSKIEKFFENLFLALGTNVLPRGSLLIFDEIQFCPKARQAIKTLVADGRYYYLETGSLVSIKENTQDILIPSEEESVQMYPMDYEEFLWACGLEFEAQAIINHFKERTAFDSNIHQSLMKNFRTYLAVGGMPKVVDTYLRTHDFYAVDKEKKKIIKLYEEDLGGEYGSHEAHHLLHTYFTNRQVDKTWAIFFKQINFNHTSVTSYFSKGVMKVENNFIIAPNSFLQVLNREFLFLPEIKNKCRLLSSTKNQVVLCDKDLDISKFPTLEFYSDELDHNFVLTGKDLFVYDETYDHLLLLVLLDLNTDNESTWELGLPLLKKELLFFDMDNEQIGVCEISPGTNISLSMIININIVILLIVIAAILSKILMKMPKQRKRRANELLDAYVEEN